MVQNNKNHQRLKLYKTFWRNPKYFRNFAVMTSAFLLAFVSISLFAPVSNSSAEQQVLASITDGEYSVAVTGQGTISLDVGQPSSAGKTVKATDTLSIAANAPEGYKLYVSMDNATSGGNRLYRNGDSSSSFLAPNNSSGQDIPIGSETTLTSNSWGFTTDATKYNNNQFAAMPLSNNIALISQASVSGNYTQNIYYGVNANTDIISGSYSGNVVYTVTSDSIPGTSGIQSINPSTISTAGGESVEITVALFSTAGISTVADLGDITVTIGGNNCPVTNKTLSGNNVVITCTTPAGTAGTKTIAVTIQKFGQTYEGEITYQDPPFGGITKMQEMTRSICANASIGDEADLLDTRGYGNGGNDKTTKYHVIKALDGNCWMADNLNLYNKTISSSDSDTTSSFTIPASSTWSNNETAAAKVHIADGTGSSASSDSKYYGQLYYNWCAATAKTSCSDTSAPTTSICPKNWDLPTYASTSSTTNGDWAKLISTYEAANGGTITGADLTTTDTSGVAYPLGFRLYYGFWSYVYTSEYNQGTYGYFWSATPSTSSTMAYNVRYGSSAVGRYNFDKGSGRSIRCVVPSS